MHARDAFFYYQMDDGTLLKKALNDPATETSLLREVYDISMLLDSTANRRNEEYRRAEQDFFARATAVGFVPTELQSYLNYLIGFVHPVTLRRL